MFTTLNQIRSHLPCASGWKMLLSHLDKTIADDEPLNIATIIDSNGLNDAQWCLRAVDGKDKEIRLYAVWCARQVHHLMTDKRSIDALDVAERFANGEATQEELTAARVAASGATWEGTWCAASGAAWCVTSDTAWGAIWGAAWYSSSAQGDIDSLTAQEARLRELCQ